MKEHLRHVCPEKGYHCKLGGGICFSCPYRALFKPGEHGQMSMPAMTSVAEFMRLADEYYCSYPKGKRAEARAALESALTEALEKGDVVVAKDGRGNIVAVTRQDEDGKILSVIATSEALGAQEQAVRVCPWKDAICGDFPRSWCADCPKRAAPPTQAAKRFHVKDFGAVGDGVADDTAAIQRAVNAVHAQAAEADADQLAKALAALQGRYDSAEAQVFELEEQLTKTEHEYADMHAQVRQLTQERDKLDIWPMICDCINTELRENNGWECQATEWNCDLRPFVRRLVDLVRERYTKESENQVRQLQEDAQRQSTPIEELVEQYRAEEGYSDSPEWLARCGLRYAKTMPDSQSRCILYGLAKFVAAMQSENP